MDGSVPAAVFSSHAVYLWGPQRPKNEPLSQRLSQPSLVGWSISTFLGSFCQVGLSQPISTALHFQCQVGDAPKKKRMLQLVLKILAAVLTGGALGAVVIYAGEAGLQMESQAVSAREKRRAKSRVFGCVLFFTVTK